MKALPLRSATGRSQGVGERGPSVLVVFSGLPGTGKTVLAEATAQARQLPVFSVAWTLGALAPFGILKSKRRRPIAYALLTMLVRRQLELGQSAIVDGMVGEQKVRSDWLQLAQRNGAVFLPIECVCSDEELHRQRIEARQETIPGWPDPDWSHVEEMRFDYEPWTQDRLILDAVEPLANNCRAALAYIDYLDAR
jgi:predicted kinase